MVQQSRQAKPTAAWHLRYMQAWQQCPPAPAEEKQHALQKRVSLRSMSYRLVGHPIQIDWQPNPDDQHDGFYEVLMLEPGGEQWYRIKESDLAAGKEAWKRKEKEHAAAA